MGIATAQPHHACLPGFLEKPMVMVPGCSLRFTGAVDRHRKNRNLCPVFSAGSGKWQERENSPDCVSDTYLNDFILIFVRESLWALSINLEIS